MNHDIIHCNNYFCKDKDNCYRYIAWKELVDNGLKGCYSFYLFNEDVDCKEKCEIPWIDMGMYIEDEGNEHLLGTNKKPE